MIEETRSTIIEADNAGQRLDRFTTMLWQDLSRARLQQLIKGNFLTVNHRATNASYKVKEQDFIELRLPPTQEATPQPQAVEFEVVHEDEVLLVINKPAGLVVHPGAGNPDQTLVNGLLNHCKDSLSGIGGIRRPGIVHRLDKGTSGLMVVAKTNQAHQQLSLQFSDRSLSRRYIAIVWGTINPFKGTIEGNIGRDSHHRQKMKVVNYGGKPAITDYQMIEKIGSQSSLVQCHLRTGRTHQIRVHLESTGYGLIGDPIYGKIPRGLSPTIIHHLNKLTQDKKRPCLHAEHLSFIHPSTLQTMRFTCPWPDDFQNVYDYLQSI